MVGKYPTPKGLIMFWDTGRKINLEQLNRARALQYASFYATGKIKVDARNKIYNLATDIAHEVNVWPEGYAALTDDGRIFVSEPWFNEKEANEE